MGIPKGQKATARSFAGLRMTTKRPKRAPHRHPDKARMGSLRDGTQGRRDDTQSRTRLAESPAPAGRRGRSKQRPYGKLARTARMTTKRPKRSLVWPARRKLRISRSRHTFYGVAASSRWLTCLFEPDSLSNTSLCKNCQEAKGHGGAGSPWLSGPQKLAECSGILRAGSSRNR